MSSASLLDIQIPEDRFEIRLSGSGGQGLVLAAMLLAEAGRNVIVDATANRRRYRDLGRRLVPDFAEVYIRADIDTCMAREAQRKAEFAPKDIYKKAFQERAAVPGINVDYEEPLDPEIDVDSSRMDPEHNAEFIARMILDMFGQS